METLVRTFESIPDDALYGSHTASAQVSNQELIAAQTGYKLMPRRLFVSVDTAMAVTVEYGDGTDIVVLYLAANSGAHLDFARNEFQGVANQNIRYSTSAAGNIFIRIVAEKKAA